VLKSTWDENPFAVCTGAMIYQYKNNQQQTNASTIEYYPSNYFKVAKIVVNPPRVLPKISQMKSNNDEQLRR
jgi:hypothetical protein